jgi:hypothetical protein
MKKVAKIITTLIILLLILVILDKFSSSSKTSLFLPQRAETRNFISKVPSLPPSHKYIERKTIEKVTLLNKNPTKISLIKENGKQYYLNYGRWVKITTYTDPYPPPYYIFENNDYLIRFQQNDYGKYEPYIEIKYRDKIGDSWYDSNKNEKGKIILVSKNATVKTPSHTYFHCIETKIQGPENFAYLSFYAPSHYLIMSEIKNTKTNKIISPYYLDKTN